MKGEQERARDLNRTCLDENIRNKWIGQKSNMECPARFLVEIPLK